jgi:hypothetical protein
VLSLGRRAQDKWVRFGHDLVADRGSTPVGCAHSMQQSLWPVPQEWLGLPSATGCRGEAGAACTQSCVRCSVHDCVHMRRWQHLERSFYDVYYCFSGRTEPQQLLDTDVFVLSVWDLRKSEIRLHDNTKLAKAHHHQESDVNYGLTLTMLWDAVEHPDGGRIKHGRPAGVPAPDLNLEVLLRPLEHSTYCLEQLRASRKHVNEWIRCAFTHAGVMLQAHAAGAGNLLHACRQHQRQMVAQQELAT